MPASDQDVSIRVASVPTDHVYVRHLDPPDGPTTVHRLPDPTSGGSAAGAPWWPPRVLEPDWLLENADRFDVVHVHFGYDAKSPEDLVRWTRVLRDLGTPLVLTVHDLRNPLHEDAALHDAQLEVLLEAADAVLTLTDGAAAEILRRYRRPARVVPHPHVVPLDRVARPREPHDGFVVGVHCKSLRASMDPLPVVETLAEVVPTIPGGRLRVDVHTDVMTGTSPRSDARLVERLLALSADRRIDLAVHDFFTDDELFDYLGSLDVSVLPYRFGTHSGWLEACHDLGTTVVAPDCGHYADQRPVLLHRTGDPTALASAVRRAHAEGPLPRATVEGRRAERVELAATHEQVYRGVLARGVLACTS